MHHVMRAICLLLADTAGVCAVGCLLPLCYYLVLGLSARNLLLYAPTIATEVSVQFVYFVNLCAHPPLAAFLRRRSRTAVFLLLLAAFQALGFASTGLQLLALRYVYAGSGADVCAMVGFGQLVVFLAMPLHDFLLGGRLTRGMDGFSASVFSILATKLVWAVFLDRTTRPDSHLVRVAGFLQFWPMVILMHDGVFRSYPAGDPLQHFGLHFAGVNFMSAVLFALTFAVDAVVNRSHYAGGFQPSVHGLFSWQCATVLWLASQILGARLYPLLPVPSRRGTAFWALWAAGSAVVLVLFDVLLVLFFNLVVFDLVIIGVLGAVDADGVAYRTGMDQWGTRPMFFFGFGTGIIYCLYLTAAGLSKSGAAGADCGPSDVEAAEDLELEETGGMEAGVAH
ncbi:Transmembrane domain-containing protein [Spironucleus salmonicida]|uniref:Transmembrane domain-containing protein n=2 Tax=Spironucleus salmonicida TaxID=348837 RepID=V6LZ08_9EUKA|nr:Transmembrane domain-containing protein [Spironucleus salmonicida]|eukprot:EST48971.1 Transmembrane domain-containing protein [Spironucleus salmonicida]